MWLTGPSKVNHCLPLRPHRPNVFPGRVSNAGPQSVSTTKLLTDPTLSQSNNVSETEIYFLINHIAAITEIGSI